MGKNRRPYYRTPEESFIARTERRGECLIWTASKKNGYGQIWVGDRTTVAHRYAWERENGPIPDGMKVDHRYHCDRACVEITHLRLASDGQNNANRAGANRTNKSTGFRNVRPHGNGFSVEIQHKGKRRYYGTYPTIEEAVAVAKRERERVFGEFSGRGGCASGSVSPEPL